MPDNFIIQNLDKIITGALIPLAAGLLVKKSWSPGVKGAVAFGLSVAFALLLNLNSFKVEDIGGSLFIILTAAQTLYGMIYKPSGLTSGLQDILVKDKPVQAGEVITPLILGLRPVATAPTGAATPEPKPDPAPLADKAAAPPSIISPLPEFKPIAPEGYGYLSLVFNTPEEAKEVIDRLLSQDYWTVYPGEKDLIKVEGADVTTEKYIKMETLKFITGFCNGVTSVKGYKLTFVPGSLLA